MAVDQLNEIPKTYKRSRYFVKPDLQTKYAFMFVLSIGVGLNLGVILTLLAPMLQNNSWVFPAIYGLLALSIVILVAGISILFTHKIAGPIYKIERSCRQIMDQKDLSLRVFLRTGDELQELAEEINRLLDHLRNSMLIEQQKSEAIVAKIDHLISTVESGSEAENGELLRQLTDIRRRLGESSLKYRL
ncbi:MAG: HAMP domain-containing protein [Candidatus Sericytochromatia bacterium]